MFNEKRGDGQINKRDHPLYVSKHSFNDLCHVCPVVFVYLLKECYVHGTFKTTIKFRALQQVLVQAFQNGPQPGPAVFVAQCLFILPIFSVFLDVFSHLIISAFEHFLEMENTQTDIFEAKFWSAKLFVNIVGHKLDYDPQILVRIVDVFKLDLLSIGKAMCGSHVNNEIAHQTAEVFLLKHFSVQDQKLEDSFLLEFLDKKEYKSAEKWAKFVGKHHLCALVGECFNRKLDSYAHEIIRKNDMREEFPTVYQQLKEREVKSHAENGFWDIAEATTNNDRQLLQYLVFLAMEAGYLDKVKELCDRYSLEGFADIKDHQIINSKQGHYLELKDFCIEEVVWVDNENGLCDATCHIQKCKVVGLDSEWTRNSEKGRSQTKVSIMQIASERKAYVLDLMKLHNDIPGILDECLMHIFDSPGILKLGYNFQSDMYELARSYPTHNCFKRYKMILGIEKVFKEASGGLSGLTKKILGFDLDKTSQSSDWKQRPLTQSQLEYAALDAIVLIYLLRNRTQASLWKSHIIPCTDSLSLKKEEEKKKKKERPL